MIFVLIQVEFPPVTSLWNTKKSSIIIEGKLKYLQRLVLYYLVLLNACKYARTQVVV